MLSDWYIIQCLLIIAVLVLAQIPLTDGCSVDGGKFIQVVEVEEEMAVDTSVGRLKLDNPERVRKLVLEEPNSYIDLVLDNFGKEASFIISQRIDIDRSGLNRLQTMSIACVDIDGVNLEIDIEFELADTNDLAPVFQPSNHYNFSFDESMPVGRQIGVVNAKDDDIDNYFVTYDLLDNERFSNKIFELKSLGNGAAAIMLASSVDYEKDKMYTVYIVAKDCQQRKHCETNQRSSTATVSIRAESKDDLSPDFDQPAYQVVLSEDTPNDAFVVELTAHDDINGTILYSLSGDNNKYFAMDQQTGTLTVKDNSGLSVGVVFTFLVKAAQASDPSRFDIATLQISIVRADWEKPAFTERNYVTFVSEYETVNNILLTMAINYNLKRKPLEVQLLDPTNLLPFSIRHEGNRVELILSRELDYEQQKSYRIMISASNSLHNDEVEVTVNVLNENDNEPAFEQSTYAFFLPYTEQGFVGKVHATDDDEPDRSPTYKLLPSEFSSLFTINDAGCVTLASHKTLYTRDSYTIVVEASDHGKPSRTSNVVLSVTLIGVTSSAITDEENSSENKLFGYIVIGSASLALAAIMGVIIFCISRKVQRKNQRTQNKELSYGGGPQDDQVYIPLSLERHRDSSSLGLMSVINGRHENTYRNMSDLSHDEKYRTILKSSQSTLADQTETRVLLSQRLYEPVKTGTSMSSDCRNSSGFESLSTSTHHRSLSDSAAISCISPASERCTFIASYLDENKKNTDRETNYSCDEHNCLEAPEEFRGRRTSTASNTSDYGSNTGTADCNFNSNSNKSNIPEDSLLPKGSITYSGLGSLGQQSAEMMVINSTDARCKITADLLSKSAHKKPFSTFHGDVV
ncbi:protocadherin-19-like [Watersipora subatra]|uniref:protocadherin-19-like n=1 Tax=Watersipora subatra TaxID=2589382 RepID=UPI00355BB137